MTVGVLLLFLAILWVGLQCVIVVLLFILALTLFSLFAKVSFHENIWTVTGALRRLTWVCTVCKMSLRGLQNKMFKW